MILHWIPYPMIEAVCLAYDPKKVVGEEVSAYTFKKTFAEIIQHALKEYHDVCVTSVEAKRVVDEIMSMYIHSQSAFLVMKLSYFYRDSGRKLVEILEPIRYIKTFHNLLIYRQFVNFNLPTNMVGRVLRSHVLRIAFDWFRLYSVVRFLQQKFDELIKPVNVTYRKVKIPKRKNGFRYLLIPNDELKAKQRVILEYLYKCFPPSKFPQCVHSFIPRRRLIDAVKKHVGNNVFLRVDIKDAFASIKRDVLVQNLKSCGFTRRSMNMIVKECYHHRFGLPQGAPTSGNLFNICMIPVDERIEEVLRRVGVSSPVSDHEAPFIYTRYADDILVSWKDSDELHGSQRYRTVLYTLEDALRLAGLRINKHKVRFRKGYIHVLGTVLHEDFVSISRKWRHNLRAKVYFKKLSQFQVNGVKGWIKSIYDSQAASVFDYIGLKEK